MSRIEPWPAWAVEPIEVLDADPGWAARGERERDLLERVLAPWLIGRVEHVGSTAVLGLAAKPIIDLQATVTELADAAAIAAVLAPHAWQFVDPELDGRAWRRFFVQVQSDHRSAHLHLLSPGEPRWSQQLAFRDALRGDPVLVEAYGALKRDLAARYAHDREAYTAAKREFIHAVLNR